MRLEHFTSADAYIPDQVIPVDSLDHGRRLLANLLGTPLLDASRRSIDEGDPVSVEVWDDGNGGQWVISDHVLDCPSPSKGGAVIS